MTLLPRDCPRCGCKQAMLNLSFVFLQVLGREHLAAQDMACQFWPRIRRGFPQKTQEGLLGEGGPQDTALLVSAPLRSCSPIPPALWLYFPALLYRSSSFASSSTHAPKIASPACPSHPDCPTPASASALASAPQGLPESGSQNGKLVKKGV